MASAQLGLENEDPYATLEFLFPKLLNVLPTTLILSSIDQKLLTLETCLIYGYGRECE